MKLETRSQKTRKAFTLVELLVVIAIIGILAALLLSGISRAKERAVRIKCLSNIKQLDLALISYGQDYKDRLPNTAVLDEPWSLPGQVLQVFTLYGMRRDILYDPGFPEYNNDKSWNDDGGGAPEIGYLLTLPGSAWLLPESQNPTIVPQLRTMLNLVGSAPDPSRRTLVAGLLLTDVGQTSTNPTLRAIYKYSGLINDEGFPLRASHMTRKLPRGDNMGMLDGSAKWRKFAEMLPRGIPNAYGVWW